MRVPAGRYGGVFRDLPAVTLAETLVGEIDAGPGAERMAHLHHVLGTDIALRLHVSVIAERTTAQPRHR
jgi:hypothetical protein